MRNREEELDGKEEEEKKIEEQDWGCINKISLTERRRRRKI